MTRRTQKINVLPEELLPLLLALSLACHDASTPPGPRGEPRWGPLAPSPGLVLVDYRALGDGPDGVAIVDADPASQRFGEVIDDLPLAAGVTPHHLYFDAAGERLYTTTLGAPYLFRIELVRGIDGTPRLLGALPVDVGANQMAEDMWFDPAAGRYYVTFLAGQGEPRDGSVGIFDDATDTLVDTIRYTPEGPSVLWPHGISGDARRGVLMVTSNEAPDPAAVPEGSVGDSVTAIDLATGTPTHTWKIEAASAPVEVMLLRGEGLPAYAIVTTMYGGDIWVAPWDEVNGTYGAFTKAVEGDELAQGTPLELYVRRNRAQEPELYVTFAEPGVVNVYGLDVLPELPLRRTLPAAPGAHHLSFFESQGRTVAVVQNNLIALDGLDTGTLSLVDAETGEPLGVVDLPATDGILPESVESVFGPSYLLHH